MNPAQTDCTVAVGLPVAGSLVACGGNDDDPPICREFLCLPEDPVAELTWDAPQHTITTSAASSEPVTVEAILTAHGDLVFTGLTIAVAPNGLTANPSCDGLYKTVASDPQDAKRFYLTVRFVVWANEAPGSYPKGSFRFTASIAALSHEAEVTTVVLVR